MLEQIELTIVAFVLGTVLTYFTTRWSKTLKKINKLEYGVQALLRDRMLQMYSYYKERRRLWKKLKRFIGRRISE